jgi:transposase
MHYMGIDHHKQYSHITVLDERGEVIKADRVGNTLKEVEVFLRDLDDKIEGVIEAGYSHYTMMDLMESEGVRMKIAHPEQIKAIAKAKIKTDKRDSKILAHLLRSNLIPEVYSRDKENREAQRVLRHRVTYVRMQTQMKNRIRALLAKQREEVREIVNLEDALFTVSGLKVLRNLDLAGRDQQMLKSLLETLDHFKGKIKLSDALVREILRNSEEARLISTLPGFGEFFSVLVFVEIADIHRFDTPAKLHSYAGLIPSTHASGDKLYHGKLVRRGNKWLRWAAVEAVWPAVRSDFDIRLYFERRKKRKGANSAKVATARRLLTIIYRVLKENRAYIPYKRKKHTAAFTRI